MQKEVTILLADDDAGHRSLMRRNLLRSKVAHEILEFEDGQLLLDFFQQGKEQNNLTSRAFVILLDIRMPKMNGVEVLQRIKNDPSLRRIPTIMLSTTDDPNEVVRCHELGCSHYVIKPVDYDKFIQATRNLGLFLSIIEVPRLN